MYNLTDFCEEIRAHILEFLPDKYKDAEVNLSERVRNGDNKYIGLSIQRNDSVITESIPLEKFYDIYAISGSINEVLKPISEEYVQNDMNSGGMSALSENFLDYEYIKSRAIVSVLNKERNKQYLEGLYHKDIPDMDLSAVVRIMCGDIHDNIFPNILVKQEHLQMWGVSGDKLYEDALNNSASFFPAEVRTLDGMIKELLCDLLTDVAAQDMQQIQFLSEFANGE